MNARSALAALAVLSAVAAGAAGCRQPGSSIPPPAFFTPSPCPPGSHLLPGAEAAARHEWGCVAAGTAPGGTAVTGVPR